MRVSQLLSENVDPLPPLSSSPPRRLPGVMQAQLERMPRLKLAVECQALPMTEPLTPPFSPALLPALGSVSGFRSAKCRPSEGDGKRSWGGISGRGSSGHGMVGNGGTTVMTSGTDGMVGVTQAQDSQEGARQEFSGRGGQMGVSTESRQSGTISKGRGRRPYKKYYSNPTPSSHCHVCARTSKAVKFAVCARISEGLCRKVTCYKCFQKFGWDWDEAMRMAEWVCVHCRGVCPEGRSQCFIYSRVNSKRESKRGAKKKKALEAAAAAAAAAAAGAYCR